MPSRGHASGRGRRAVRPAVLRRSVEALERRDLLALVVAPLALTEDVPFSGRIATFAGTDVQANTISDIKPTITWGDGTTTTSMNASIVPDGPGFDVIAAKTYTQFGTFPVTVTVAGLNNTSVYGSGSAAVADAPLTPTGTTFTATAGQTFNGVVGSFQDVNSSSVAGDFTVKIDWGDGQTSLGTAAPTTTGQLGTQRYNVSGSHVYGATGTDLVKFTVVRSSSGQSVMAASTANVIAPLLNLFPATVSGAPGQAITNALFATLVDSNTLSSASDFSATIAWGAGLPTTTGTVTAVPGSPGHYLVAGTFTYSAPGVYHPVVTVVRTTLNQIVMTTSTADIAATPLTVAPAPAVPFTGVLDPTSAPRFFRGLLVTSRQEPTLSGTAAPGSSVSLSIRRLGLGDPITIGETVADPNGRWSLIVGPLGGPPFLLYGVATPVANPPTPVTLLNNGIPILVTNPSLHGRRFHPGPHVRARATPPTAGHRHGHGAG